MHVRYEQGISLRALDWEYKVNGETNVLHSTVFQASHRTSVGMGEFEIEFAQMISRVGP